MKRGSTHSLLLGVVLVLFSITLTHAFSPLLKWTHRRGGCLQGIMSSTTSNNNNIGAIPDYNGVVSVAKTGGRGVVSASQHALEHNLSLGAPRARPTGGHYLTKGGIQVTVNVDALEFSTTTSSGSGSAMEGLVTKLDHSRGAILHSSYEFPGRYARWSLGFVDPPLKVSGRANVCCIRALNARGRILLPAIYTAMLTLKEDGILERVSQEYNNNEDAAMGGGTGDAIERMPTSIHVTVVPMSQVGTFSEEERSRQVYIVVYIWIVMHIVMFCKL